MDVVCLGEIILDMFAAEIGRKMAEVSAFIPTPGGAPANVAVGVSRLGLKSAFIGKVGEDAFGHHLAQVLINEKVNTRGLRFDPQERTTLNFIALPDENSAEFLFYRNPGADACLRPDELDVDLIRESRFFCSGSLSLIDEPLRSTTLQALSVANEAGCPVLLDANYRPTLWSSPGAACEAIHAVLPLVQVLKVNETELSLITGKYDSLETACHSLLSKGPELVVVTLGVRGCFYQSTFGKGQVPGFRVKTIEATGCGDAFSAAMLYGLLQGDNWREHLDPISLDRILRFANAAGALTSMKKGVIPALPRFNEVVGFLSHQIHN